MCGQYYKPVNVKTLEYLYSHEYDQGSKLMEHSYIGNPFVGAAMRLLSPGQRWHRARIVWCGDYSELKQADVIPPSTDAEKMIELAAPAEGNNLYSQCEVGEKLKPRSMGETMQKKAFICNHTKKLFVDCSKLTPDKGGWLINPLPILTSSGNGQGGGDYSGSQMDLVGTWAGNEISVEKKSPKGFVELTTNFTE